MRASWITLLLATGLSAVVACRGNGGGNGPSGQAGPLENGSYQRPSSSYEDPPSTPQPTDYEKPPSIYEGGGSGTPPASTPGAGAPCNELCAMAAAQNCADELDNSDSIAAQPFDECVKECKTEFAGYSCPDDLARVSACIIDHVDELDCRQLEQIGAGNPNNIPQDARDACTDSILALIDCLEGGDDPGNGGSCTISGRCICDDPCASCRCENLGDDGPCTDCRRNP
jgi:hypothetical protein